MCQFSEISNPLYDVGVTVLVGDQASVIEGPYERNGGPDSTSGGVLKGSGLEMRD